MGLNEGDDDHTRLYYDLFRNYIKELGPFKNATTRNGGNEVNDW